MAVHRRRDAEETPKRALRKERLTLDMATGFIILFRLRAAFNSRAVRGNPAAW
jgi:hypothetical protein